MRLLIALTLVVFACGNKATDDTSAQSGQNNDRPAKIEPPPQKESSQKQAAAGRSAQAPSPHQVCEKVFPIKKAGAVLGTELVAPKPPKGNGAKVECTYVSKDGDGKKGLVKLIADCRSTRSKRAVMKAAFEKNKGFEESELGFYLRQIGQHQFIAFTDSPGCTLTVTTGFVKERKVDELAKLVVSNLNESTAPR